MKLPHEISWHHSSSVWSSLWLACWTQQTSAPAALHPVAASVWASPPLLGHKQKYEEEKNNFNFLWKNTIFCKHFPIFFHCWFREVILMAKIQFVLSHYFTSSTFGVALKTEQANLWKMEMFYSSASGSKTKRNIVMGNKRWKGQYTEGTPFGRKVAAGPFWPCFACPKLGYAGRTQVAKMGWCNEELASHNFDLKQNPPERIFYIYMEYPLRRILL